MDEDGNNAVENDGLLLSDAIDGGIFVYVPCPDYFKNGPAPRSFVFCSPQGGRGVVFRPPRECIRISNARQKRWISPLLPGTMMVNGFMNFMLPIHTFNNLVLIVWRNGQETMQNLKPVYGAS